MKIKKRLISITKYTLLLLGMVLILSPIYLAIITALKTPAESASNFFALPSGLYLGNFIEVINRASFETYVLNSVVITGVSLLFISILLPMVSYSIARNLKKKYYKFLLGYFTIGMFIPFQVIMIPVTKLMSQLNLLNKAGLILLYLTFSFIQGVFLYVGYIKTLPFDLEEAAYIDGCTVIRAYWMIILPLLKPMSATIFIMNALWIWNDFLLPLLMLNRSPKFWTLQLFQYNFKSQYSFDYNLAFSSFLMCMIPIIIVYIFMQKNIISGLTSGAVKS